MEQISLEKLLKDEPSKPGLVELYQRTMLHRTNEAMNGLSHRLDKLLAQTVENSAAQSKQQKTMAWLTFVIAAATVIYTATTIYATKAAGRSPEVKLVSSAGPVPESAAVHMGADAEGRPAVCVNGQAYEVPGRGDEQLRGRFEPARTDGVQVSQLHCKN